jgi:DNA polymerase-4/protein ImuB
VSNVKILCVLLSHFPLRCEILRHPDIENCPVVITYGDGSQKLVLDYSSQLDGLQPGAPVQQALARYDKAELIQADIPYYWSTFNRLLDEMEGITPLVEGSELGTAYLGVDGLELIFPDEDSLAGAVRKVIPAIFTARIGIAGGKFPAYLAALQSSPHEHKVLTGNLGAFLKDISCDVLPVPMKIKNKLRDFGIRTLGELAVLPRGPLQSQFGPKGMKIRDLAGGYDDTPLYPRMMEVSIEEGTQLPSVTVSLEAILVAMETLLSKVFAGFNLRGLGIHSLVLWTRSWDSEHWERKIHFKEPAMDLKTGVTRIKRVLESFPQPGPVEEVGMRVTRLGCPRGRQGSLFDEVRGRDHLLEDIRQLELRQGNTQVFKIKEVEPWSRIPERRYALTPTDR